MGMFDNSAKLGYNQIIYGFAMLLAARCLVMPTTTMVTHTGVLSQMKYIVNNTRNIQETHD